MSNKTNPSKKHLELKGHLLIAMPSMEDTRFARAIVLVCSHSEEGSMGFILNQPVSTPLFTDILEELDIEEEILDPESKNREVPIFRGGPVEQGRGFVVHSLDFSSSASARVGDLAGVTATLEALRCLAGPTPPENAIMLLGYAGWSEGQLEDEIIQNGWLTMPASRALVFETHHTMQYDAALAAMGISEATLSTNVGHA
ncbi:MAG: YqgE/AlgH family protein [Rhizobiaceae bacterium]